MRRPVAGSPHAPTRIRVATRVLAYVLRAHLPSSIEIVCAPTPEIDAAFETLRARAELRARETRSFLLPMRDRRAVASLFQAARALHDALPSTRLAEGDALLSMTIDRLELQDLLVCLTGREGSAPALLQLHDRDAYDRYLAATTGASAGQRPRRPAHLAIRFVASAALSRHQRAELTRHRWPLAHADACPQADFVDEDGILGPPSSHEHAGLEAAASAVAKLVAEGDALLVACRGGAPFQTTVRVETSVGEVAVKVSAPYVADRERAVGIRRLVAALGALDARDTAARGPLDCRALALRTDLDEDLMIQFVASREGRATEELLSCQRLIDVARAHFGVSVAGIRPAELRELVFETMPRVAPADGPSAGGTIDALRAFYAFLKRMEALPQADACLAVLAGDATTRLERALGARREGGCANTLAV
jgi:hypothetical protein